MSLYTDLALESLLTSLPLVPRHEIILFAMKGFGGYDLPLAFAIALGVTMAGSVLTWLVGRMLGRLFLRYGGPLNQKRWYALSIPAQTYGSMLLACSWFYLLGPMLVFLGGFLGIRWWQFLLITLLGKLIYYGWYGFV